MANNQFTAVSANELDAIVLEIVDPRIKDIVDRSAVFWNLAVDGKGQETNEKGVRLISEFQPNPAFSWFGEGAAYQSPGRAQYLTMNVKYARLNIATQITRDVIEHKDATLVAPIMTRLASSDTKTMVKELNQQSYGDGSGTRALVASHVTASTTALTCDLPFRASKLIPSGTYDFIASTAGQRNNAGESGTTYAIGDKIGSATLTSFVNSTGVCTMVGIPADVRAGDFIVSPGAYNICMHGLDYIVNNTGTFQNASRTTYPRLKSVVDSNGGSRRAFTVAMLEKNIQQLKFVRGTEVVQGMKFSIISSPTQVTAYNNLANGLLNSTSNMGTNSLRRFEGDSKALDLGFSTYSYKGIEWIEDIDCPEDHLYILNLESIQKFKFKELGLVNTSGLANGLSTVPAFDSTGAGSLKDAVMYIMTAKHDLGSPDPAHNVKIADLFINADDSNLPSRLLSN